MTDNIFNALYETIKDRKQNPAEGSYTSYLFDKGIDKILKKVGEECTEVIIEAAKGNKEGTKEEICDLLYHMLVMMADMGIELEEVESTLAYRHKVTGNKKDERKEIQQW